MESEKIREEKERESPQYYYLPPKSQSIKDANSLIEIQKTCNEIGKPFEQKGLQNAIGLHGNRSDKIQGLMFEDLTKGSIAQQAHIKKQPIEFPSGDGTGVLRNGQKTSVKADIVLENPVTGNYKEIQLKAGANKQNTIYMAEKHYKNSDIEVCSFKGYENDKPLVKGSIEFEKIEMEMMKPEHLNDFMKNNEELIQSVGNDFKTVQNEKKILKEKLVSTKKDLVSNQEKAQKSFEQLQRSESRNQKLEQHLETLKEKINEYSEEISKLEAEISQKEVACKDYCKNIADKMVTFYEKRLLDLKAFKKGAYSGFIIGYLSAISAELVKWATGEKTFSEFVRDGFVCESGKAGLIAGAIGGAQAWGAYASEFAMNGKTRILAAGAEKINVIFTAGAFIYSALFLLKSYSAGKISGAELVKELGLSVLGIGGSLCSSLVASAVGGIPGVIIGVVGGIIFNLLGRFFGGMSQEKEEEKSYEERMKEAEKRIFELRGLHIKLWGVPEYERDLSHINKIPETAYNVPTINQIPSTSYDLSGINKIPETAYNMPAFNQVPQTAYNLPRF